MKIKVYDRFAHFKSREVHHLDTQPSVPTIGFRFVMRE